jgi:hypothetical protein
MRMLRFHLSLPSQNKKKLIVFYKNSTHSKLTASRYLRIGKITYHVRSSNILFSLWTYLSKQLILITLIHIIGPR